MAEVMTIATLPNVSALRENGETNMAKEKVKVTEEGYVLDEQEICLKLINGEEITGKINIAEYNVDRLSEVFTKVGLTYITLYNCDGNPDMKDRVLIINKSQILWVEPQ
jgi:hypothetical protein